MAEGDESVVIVTSLTLARRGSPAGSVVGGAVVGGLVVLVTRGTGAVVARAVVVVRRGVDVVTAAACVVVELSSGAMLDGASLEVEVVDSLVLVVGRIETFCGWLLHAASTAAATRAAVASRLFLVTCSPSW